MTVAQTLYSGSAFAAVRGARSLREINEAGLDLQRDNIIHQTRQLYYGALLARRQVDVLESSVARTAQTLAEADLLVAQGVQPKLTRLQAEVQLANQETQLIQAQAQAENGPRPASPYPRPPRRPAHRAAWRTRPRRTPTSTAPSASSTRVGTAVDERPDLEQARIAVELQQVQRNITRAAYFPTVSAFANLGFSGNIPDNRAVVTQRGGRSSTRRAATASSRTATGSRAWLWACA